MKGGVGRGDRSVNILDCLGEKKKRYSRKSDGYTLPLLALGTDEGRRQIIALYCAPGSP